MLSSSQLPVPSALNLATYSLPSFRYLSPAATPPPISLAFQSAVLTNL